MSSVANGYVDHRVSLAFVGTVLKYLGVTPLFPLVLSLYYGEDPLPFVLTSAVMVSLGFALEQLCDDGDLGNREAFLLVSLSWLVVPMVGILPYLVAGTGTVGALTVDGVVNAVPGLGVRALSVPGL